MIHDLFTYLALQHIQRIMDPSLAREQRDFECQLLESMLAEPRDSQRVAEPFITRAERQLLGSYLDLSLSDVKSLAPATHVWFLERLCAAPESMSEGAERVAGLYFLSGDGLVRYLVVNALLAFEHRRPEKMADDQHTALAPLWHGILADEGLSRDERAALLEELADILIDLVDLELPEGFHALQECLWAERKRWPPGERESPVESRIVARAKLLGGPIGKRLLGLRSRD